MDDIEAKVTTYEHALDSLLEEARQADAAILAKQTERRQLGQLIDGLRDRLAALGAPPKEPIGEVLISPGAFYRSTVRDAIKKLLTEIEARPLTTAEITARLEKGGMQTSGSAFLSNVSAVLSQMDKKHGEVWRDSDGRWSITSPNAAIGDDDVPF